MSEQIIANLQAMLKQNDNALIRFSLGNAHLNKKQHTQAQEHLKIALQHDPEYSAAWKLYGKTLAADGKIDLAIETYQKGITIAEKKGDIQAAKEMKIFLKRLSIKKAPKES